jgi:hypothetical protein
MKIYKNHRAEPYFTFFEKRPKKLSKAESEQVSMLRFKRVTSISFYVGRLKPTEHHGFSHGGLYLELSDNRLF